jgi:NADH-ubiquinone oxidoreductase subunit F-like iron-sulfur protein
LEELGGGLRDSAAINAVMIGGPLAGVIPPHLLDTPFGFEELHAIGACVGHGGIVAFDEHTSISELIEHVFSFGAFESCGKCTPCRVGSGRVEQVFADIVKFGAAPATDFSEFEQLITALKWTSLCGHGSRLREFAESVKFGYQPVSFCWLFCLGGRGSTADGGTHSQTGKRAQNFITKGGRGSFRLNWPNGSASEIDQSRVEPCTGGLRKRATLANDNKQQ